MSVRQRAVLIGLCVVVLLLGGAAAAVALHGRSTGSAATSANATVSTAVASDTPLVSLAPVPVGVSTTLPPPRSTTTTAAAVNLLTTTTVAAPSDAPTTLPALATTAAPATTAGPVVAADGALLQPPATAQVRPLGPGGDCQALVDKGFSGTCGVVGSLAYLAERSVATNGWRAYVFRVDAQKDATVVLQSLDDSGADYSLVKVIAADVLGDGSRLVGFGFHLAGNTQTLAVDMVDATGAVAMHRDLAHGSAWMSVGSFDDWALASGDPAGGYVHTVIHFVSGAWRIVQRGPATSAPASQL